MRKITIRNIKGIRNLEFILPNKKGLYVLTGSNGSGKTTLLTCLWRLTDSYAFQRDFRTSSDRVDVYEGEIIYQLDKKTVSYSHSKVRWTGTPRKNTNILKNFGYPQVRHLSATGRLHQYSDELNPTNFKAVRQELKDDLNRIFATTKFDNLRYVQVGSLRGRGKGNQRWKKAYVIKKTRNSYYSEKNFSLGELLVLNLLDLIKDVPNDSLLLIDELEMALHPRVQYKLLKYLEEKASNKLTIILSTHSSSLIKTCKNLIYLENDGSGNIEVYPNAYPAYVLKEVAIEEDNLADYIFYVEDDMAKALLHAMLNHYFAANTSKYRPFYKILPIGSFENVLKFAQHSKGYIFHEIIGQYIFLDKDVSTTYQKLRTSGNSRSEAEEILFQRFIHQADKINYLPITPEKGIWEYIDSETRSFQTDFTNTFPDSTLDLERAITDIKSHFYSSSSNSNIDNKGAKRRIKKLVKTIQETDNIPETKIIQCLSESFTKNFFQDKENRNAWKGKFGSIFSN